MCDYEATSQPVPSYDSVRNLGNHALRGEYKLCWRRLRATAAGHHVNLTQNP